MKKASPSTLRRNTKRKYNFHAQKNISEKEKNSTTDSETHCQANSFKCNFCDHTFQTSNGLRNTKGKPTRIQGLPQLKSCEIFLKPPSLNRCLLIKGPTRHICILYRPGPVLAVLAHIMGIWSHPFKNDLLQHTSKMNFVNLEKFPVIPEV